MDYSFPHYLLSKQTVDERALNQDVYQRLVARLPAGPVRLIEVGAGLGTMALRLLKRGLLRQGEYVIVDEMPENIDYAREWLPQQIEAAGFRVERLGPDGLRAVDDSRDVHIRIAQADVFDFIRADPQPADLLIAHAFLDLLPMPASLAGLLTLLKPGGLAWLTLNFDGLTTLEPVLDPVLDATIETLYHRSMDTRPTGGDSRSGRHLFANLRAANASILAAGASDWVVFAHDGHYPADEAYFLEFILHFFESSLAGHPDLDAPAFAAWLEQRRGQVRRGELVYIAHQMDFLAQA